MFVASTAVENEDGHIAHSVDHIPTQQTIWGPGATRVHRSGSSDRSFLVDLEGIYDSRSGK